MASSLILGTMNIIGDATNPFEFTPNPADVNEAEFQAAQSEAAAAFQTLTIAVRARSFGQEASVCTTPSN